MVKRHYKALLTVAALMMIVIVAASSVAYFTSRDRTGNVYAIGSISIRLEEPAWDPDITHDITPGAVHAKDPTVINDGDNDAYVRIRLRVTDYAAFKAHGGDSFDPASMFDIGDNWELTEGMTVKNDEACYVYTYKEILPKGASSQPLFTGVTIPDFANEAMTDAMGKSFDVIAAADAIQSDGFDNHTDAFEAFDAQIGG